MRPAIPGKIRSLTHPDGLNHGMSATRNLGIAQARGTYIGFLDCDDVWEPDKLRQQLAVMEANPTAGMIYGRTLIWHSWNEAAASSDYYYDLGVPADALYPPPQLLYTLLASTGQSPTTCNALMRADLVAAVGGFEDSFRGMFEDQVFFAKVLLRAPVFVDERTWAKYRQHDNSFSARSAREHGDEAARLHFLVWFWAYALSHRPAQLAVHGRVARQIGSALMRRTRRAWRELKSSPA